MEPNSSNFLQQILSGGTSLGTPNFTKRRSGFKLDSKNRIKVDPITGEKIKPKDRISFKKFRRNPMLITPGMSLNMNVPNLFGGTGNLAQAINSVGRLQ